MLQKQQKPKFLIQKVLLWQSLCFLSCPKIVFSGSGKTKKSVEFNVIFQTWKVKKFDYRSQKVWEQWREKCIYWTAIFTFFSHQFLHHWAWKHYLGPEVVKVIESYFEFYKCEIVWILRYHPSVTIWEKVPMHGAQK